MAFRKRETELPPPLPTDYAPPEYRPNQPHVLGSTTLQAVDMITGMSADELDKVADKVEEAGRETADLIRALAIRVRENGIHANERLANFVGVASHCADLAKKMSENIEARDNIEPVEKPGVSVDLDQLESQVTGETDHADLAEGGDGKVYRS